MTVKANKNAVVLLVDCLSAGMLGPYGNTWLETPDLNRLASQSLLFDFALTDSTLLETTYRSFWTGLHAVEPADRLSSESVLPALLSRHGIENTLLTDDDELEQSSLCSHFSQRIMVSSEKRGRLAEEIEETQLAAIIAAGISQIAELDVGHLLWIHTAGMKTAWDAPFEFRNAFADEDDPTPPAFVDPPARMLESNPDPDELLGVMQAYGGQIVLLDACLGALVEALDEQSRSETMLILTSPRGFPLGEHRRVGAWDSSVYNESLAVPLLIRVPGHDLDGQRSQALVQPADLFETLCGWFNVAHQRSSNFGADLIALARDGTGLGRDRACSIGASDRALRTPAWFLRQTDTEKELYAKPDDRWEMNNVVQRCPAVAEEMGAALDDFQKCGHSGFTEPLMPLSHTLLSGLE